MSDRDEAQYVLIEKQEGGSFGAFLWGAALGAGIALLLAPRSGEQTRNEIRAGVQRIRDRAEDAVRSATEGVTGRIDGVKSGVTDRMDAARTTFEMGRQAARDMKAEYQYRSTASKRPAPGSQAAAEEETEA